ncbi:MAG: hypothetical protein ACR2OC_02250 [Solirubrobacterales bacterium]
MLGVTLVFLLVLGSTPSGSPIGTPSAEARCGERLAAKYNVVSRYPKLYALQYKKRLKVSVTTHHGPLVEWQVQLYTFQGQLLGQSKRKSTLNNTKTAKVKLRFPIQEGKFTLVVKGYPRGCHAESVTSDVVRFSGCTTKLPLKFPDKPGGIASDYGGFLSVPVESRNGALIKRPESEVFSFGGEFFGRSIDDYKVVFGRVTFNNKLVKPLRAGGYTVIVSGRIDQPRQCGDKTAQTELTFG